MSKKRQDLGDPESFTDENPVTEEEQPSLSSQKKVKNAPLRVDELIVGSNVTITLRGEVVAVNKLTGYTMIRTADGIKQFSMADNPIITLDT